MTNKIRHPEKENKPINPIKKKPDWIRSKLTNSKEFFLTKTIVNNNNSSFFKLDKRSLLSLYEKRPLSPDKRLKAK